MISKWFYEGNQCKYTKILLRKTTPLILTKDNPVVNHDVPSWIKFDMRACNVTILVRHTYTFVENISYETFYEARIYMEEHPYYIQKSNNYAVMILYLTKWEFKIILSGGLVTCSRTACIPCINITIN